MHDTEGTLAFQPISFPFGDNLATGFFRIQSKRGAMSIKANQGKDQRKTSPKVITDVFLSIVVALLFFLVWVLESLIELGKWGGG